MVRGSAVVGCLVVVSVALAPASSARAQVGDGWTAAAYETPRRASIETRRECTLLLTFGDEEIPGGSLFWHDALAACLYDASDSLRLVGSLGYAYGSVSPDGAASRSRWVAGNPFAGVAFRLHPGELDATIGAGLALPLATLPDAGSDPLSDADFVVALVALDLAVGGRGLRSAWLWLPDTASIVVPARLEWRRPEGLVGGVEMIAALLVPTSDLDDDTDVALEVAGDIGHRSGRAHAGAVVAIVFIPTAGGDNAQISIEPFVRVVLSPPVFAEARLTINLDEPYGFGFGDDGIWALTIGGGAAL